MTKPVKNAMEEVREAIAANIKKLEGVSAKHRAKLDNDIELRKKYDEQAAKYVHNADNSVTQTRGRNSKTTTYNPETGRPLKESGVIRNDFGSSARGDNASKFGGNGDDGGHIGAHRFFGDTTDVGIMSQNANLNRGAWKKMENEWADYANKGYEISYEVKIKPGVDGRPDKISVDYQVTNPATGEMVRDKSKVFKNQAGESFDRVANATIDNLKRKASCVHS